MVDPNREHERERELNAALELLHFGYRAFTADPDRILAAQGLQRVHHRILYFVGRNPGLGVNELLAILGVSKQALHAPLRQLAQLGFVEARPAQHDRRVKRLSLSDSGVRLERQLSGSQRARLGAVFADLGAEREAAWREVMAKVAGELPNKGTTL
jgi:DNA-binding MarR family transcriptional regulator